MCNFYYLGKLPVQGSLAGTDPFVCIDTAHLAGPLLVGSPTAECPDWPSRD